MVGIIRHQSRIRLNNAKFNVTKLYKLYEKKPNVDFQYSNTAIDQPMKSNITRFLSSVCLSLLLASCATFDSSRSWPPTVPERAYFVKAFHAQYRNHSRSALNRHLTWIKRFYHGTVIYPLGWNRMTEQLMDSLNLPAARAEAKQRLHELGKSVSVEWAQDNSVRKINSANIATWGNALRTSAELGEQLEFIGRVEQDVEKLLNGTLHKSDIQYERYYPAQDIDNF